MNNLRKWCFPASADDKKSVTEKAIVPEKESDSDSLKVIVPSYVFATTDGRKAEGKYWSDILSLGKKIEYAMINPADGPGEEAKPEYASLLEKAKKAGVKILGYVTTDLTRNSVEVVMGQVDKYFELYGLENIAGFFFDEYVDKTPENIQYYTELYSKFKAKYSEKVIVGNRGKRIVEENYPNADIHCSFEADANTYLTAYENRKAPSELNPDNNGHFYHIVHSATPEQYDEIIAKAKERKHAKYLFITTDTGTNPYDQEPDGFLELVDKITS